MTSAPVSMDHVMLLAGIIFCIGLMGVMVRRNILYILMSLEITLNATGLAFIAAGSYASGDRLPSEREMIGTLGMSRSTLPSPSRSPTTGVPTGKSYGYKP